MRNLILTLCAFFALLSVQAQRNIIPDTLYEEMIVDTTTTIDTASVNPIELDTTTIIDTSFLLFLGETLPRTGRMAIRPIDAKYNKREMLTRIKAIVKENEDKQALADAYKMQADDLTAIYVPANQIFVRYAGRNLVTELHRDYREQHIGLYRATLGASQIFVKFTANGSATQVDKTGRALDRGYSGTWRAITEDRYRLNNFFPAQIAPRVSVWTRGFDGKFGVPGYVIRMEKVR